MSTSRVALAGATGNLGKPVLQALLDSGFHVTALSRLGGNSSCLQAHPNLTIRKVDFGSVRSPMQALNDTEVVICCFATTAIGQQYALIDAAVAARVRRFIPAEFGMDSTNPLCMQLPVCKPKAETQAYLQKQAEQSSQFSWTGIANGLFLDWGIGVGFIIDPARRRALLYNGGDVRFSATLLSDVAKGVVSIIRNQDATANRILYIHSAATTQNQLIKYAGLNDGDKWSTQTLPTDKVNEDSFIQLSKGNVQEAMDGFCKVAMWDPRYGCDFSDHLDNDLLGIKIMQEQDVSGLVNSFLR